MSDKSSAPSVGVSITGKLTHFASLAVALFALSVVAWYLKEPLPTYLLLATGTFTWAVYMFFSVNSYREDQLKREKTGTEAPEAERVTRLQLVRLMLDAKEKFTAQELESIYEWLNQDGDQNAK